ncbi:MAG TPA: HAD family hydrolase [Bauldia sp.]|nr:HAD family hydrolase [Bauldia sp.]
MTVSTPPCLALATDYDETIALEGVVDPKVVRALASLRKDGRPLVLVTGRELDDLRRVFPDLAVFHRIVAENGGLLYDPETGRERPLGPPPTVAFVEALKERGVAPLEVGRVVVATREPYHHAVLEAIRALGMELQIIFNKGGVMVLPPGINKASGLKAAAGEIGVPLDAFVAVGDAENDHALLAACGTSAAVANALPMLKESADIVLSRPAGAGVVELIRRVWGIAGDDRAARLTRRSGRGPKARPAEPDPAVARTLP